MILLVSGCLQPVGGAHGEEGLCKLEVRQACRELSDKRLWRGGVVF